jgi:hypothetical protein
MSEIVRLLHNKYQSANAAREIIDVVSRILRYKYILYLMRAQIAEIINIPTGGMYSEPLGV